MKKEADATMIEAGGRVEHHNINNYEHTLTINNLMKDDSGEYMFTLNKYEKYEQPDLLGAILVVTGNTWLFFLNNFSFIYVFVCVFILYLDHI